MLVKIVVEGGLPAHQVEPVGDAGAIVGGAHKNFGLGDSSGEPLRHSRNGRQ
jgi:hypothetical protein